MEYFSAKKLREVWGNKTCNHPKIEREYYGDTYTLDFVCSQCGKEFNILEMFELKESQKKERKVAV